VKWVFALGIGAVLVSNVDASVSLRAVNQERMAALLREKRIEEAEKFLPYFNHPEGQEHELLAQYYLLTCRPQAAHAEILKIGNGQKKDIFEAVLFSLVGLKSSESSAPLAPSRVTSGVLKLKLDREEIWRDEWKDVRVSEKKCRDMPTIQNEALAEQYNQQARIRFERLPTEVYYTDFGLVALALEVKANLPGSALLLQHYRSFHENPHYRRLLAHHRENVNQADTGLRARLNEGGQEFITNPLDVEVLQFKKAPFQIPVLLNSAEKNGKHEPKG